MADKKQPRKRPEGKRALYTAIAAPVYTALVAMNQKEVLAWAKLAADQVAEVDAPPKPTIASLVERALAKYLGVKL